jgi:hypothetical protein
MKKVSLLFIAFLLTGAIMAQVPQAINYQAVARNNAGAALATQSIKVRLTIVRNAVSQYSETRQVVTNALGLFNVQIGSSGALVTTGSFTAIDWTNNPQPLMLKVELDISNSNVFTDMGFQTFATVPYSFTAAEAINTTKIGGRNVDPTSVPATGDVLQWNGTAWVAYTLPAQPITGSWAGSIPQIASGGGGGAPWVFAGPTVTLTVDGTQKIMANANATFGHGNNNPQTCSFALCWADVSNPTILTAFQGNNYPGGTIAATGNKTNLSATGLITLPAGTYKIGFGLKNKSANVNFGANDYVNGTYMIIK